MQFLQSLDEQSGVLLVDKPTGVTSHDVVTWARRVLGVKRIGHAGTLDPLATGLLILLVGREFTKLQDTFLKQDKEYWCTFELGVVSDTYDTDGTVVMRAGWEEVSRVSRKDVEKALEDFRGEIIQTVPPFSAVRQGGKKLYELARKGRIDFQTLPTRRVKIHRLELQEFVQDATQQKTTVSIGVVCSSGTYIRSLVHDLGKVLGVGAVVTNLRRVGVGRILVAQALVCPVFTP